MPKSSSPEPEVEVDKKGNQTTHYPDCKLSVKARGLRYYEYERHSVCAMPGTKPDPFGGTPICGMEFHGTDEKAKNSNCYLNYKGTLPVRKHIFNEHKAERKKIAARLKSNPLDRDDVPEADDEEEDEGDEEEEAWNCSECGATLEGNETNCPGCGERIDGEVDSSTDASPVIETVKLKPVKEEDMLLQPPAKKPLVPSRQPTVTSQNLTVRNGGATVTDEPKKRKTMLEIEQEEILERFQIALEGASSYIGEDEANNMLAEWAAFPDTQSRAELARLLSRNKKLDGIMLDKMLNKVYPAPTSGYAPATPTPASPYRAPAPAQAPDATSVDRSYQRPYPPAGVSQAVLQAELDKRDAEFIAAMKEQEEDRERRDEEREKAREERERQREEKREKEAKIAELTKERDAIRSDLDRARSDIQVVKTDLERTKDTLNMAKVEAERLKSEKDQLKHDFERGDDSKVLKEKVNTLTERVQEQKDLIAELKGKSESLNAELRSKIEAITAERENTKKNHEEKIADLKERYKDEIAKVEKVADDLRKQIDTRERDRAMAELQHSIEKKLVDVKSEVAIIAKGGDARTATVNQIGELLRAGLNASVKAADKEEAVMVPPPKAQAPRNSLSPEQAKVALTEMKAEVLAEVATQAPEAPTTEPPQTVTVSEEEIADAAPLA